ncbi:peptidoglycan-binding protein LysM [Flavivirga spongiicola]|uniref:Peptidoglycan-binding protein LysM n=1 Tax=Flavivirga spongiicola TaxID=421621 RepID=A0ABU7XUQ8_9FLAO|nr:peptidoglycan-binding protein LysM [Flavivirga sp. MEBiC05379]MDO5979169.1 peptidoglycan-binding protein LysM [Flavivirga sp. MEBiC05379]
MGLFSFIKNAGAKVFGIGTTDAEDAEAAAAEALKLEKAAAEKLKQTIVDLQLQIENLNIFIDEDIAIVTGLAYDQATKEKVVLVIGNSKGIAIVDDQMTVEHTEPEAQFHTVISGDTLGKIAKEFYDDAMKYPVIFEANKPMLTDPDKIYPGQLLRIPALN